MTDSAFPSLFLVHLLPLLRYTIKSFPTSLLQFLLNLVLILGQAAHYKAHHCSGRSVILYFPQNSTHFRSTQVTSFTYGVVQAFFFATLPLPWSSQNRSSLMSSLVLLSVTFLRSARLLMYWLKVFI